VRDRHLQSSTSYGTTSGTVKVVNLSIGYAPPGGVGCAPQTYVNQADAAIDADAGMFRQFFLGSGRNIVWTIAAANLCAPFVGSAFGANADLPNVISVAATNSDGSLASFSDYGPGVDVAAPGGEYIDPSSGQATTDGIKNTSVVRCPSGYCGTYADDIGTSMAAPAVAGIAALEFAANSNITAAEAGRCITSTAGMGGTGSTTGQSPYPRGFNSPIPYSGSPIPIVNAAAAVNCAQDAGYITFDGSAGTGSPPATLGPFTMQSFPSDSTSVGDTESTLAGPTGNITFDSPLTHEQVGNGWQTWSNDYSGDVYDDTNQLSDGTFEVTVTLPPNTGAFYLYGEPADFQAFAMTATANDGTTSGATTVEGDAGAQYFGFYAQCGHAISSVTIAEGTGDDSMGIGEFGIAPAC